MVNTSPPLNPLRRWRKSQPVPMTLVDAAELFGVSHVAYRSWELYPNGNGGKMPSPDNWTRIREVTSGAVSPNDFYDLLREAA
jgi:hypothetical protein